MNESRRPLKTRSYRWARQLAQLAVGVGISPNQMSVLGVGFAVAGLAALLMANCSMATCGISFVLAAICIQLRLLSNMLDGLMAVEEGQKAPTGALYNEIPDRLSDLLLIVGAGFSSEAPHLGWAAAILAVLTAYIRAVGASLGHGHDFCGPMAKPHRMFVLTIACLVSASAGSILPLWWGLVVIALGSLVTVVRRTVRLGIKMQRT